ncbi:MAG: glycoside hydrolase family 9 protein [Cyanobacteria bacterium]|nr:glycoside hydrolase family 9 protein [Cyanobacteriota bacterium]
MPYTMHAVMMKLFCYSARLSRPYNLMSLVARMTVGALKPILMPALLRTFSWSLICCIAGFLLFASPGELQAQQRPQAYPSIILDGSGYHPNSPKYLIWQAEGAVKPAKLVIYDPEKPGFMHRKGQVSYEPIPGQVVNLNPLVKNQKVQSWEYDFSEFKTSGSYQIRFEGEPTTLATLVVSDFSYWDTMRQVFRSLFLERCGIELEDSKVKLKHAACHLNDGVIWEPQAKLNAIPQNAVPKDATGGWHESGSYNKYVRSTAYTIAKLLGLYDWNPKAMNYFKLDYPLSEPNLGEIPDYLHEVKIGTDWLLSMQRRDGGFYGAVISESETSLAEQPEPKLPEEEESTRWLTPGSIPDNAAAVAALAMTSRSFRQKDLSYSIKALIAAEKGWQYLQNQNKYQSYPANFPQPLLPKAFQKANAGNALFRSDSSESTHYMLWAAFELYSVTGKAEYHKFILQHRPQLSVQPSSWQNPIFLGYVDYILFSKAPDPELKGTLKQSIIKLAELLHKNQQTNPMHISLHQYPENSNSLLTEQTWALLTAYRLNKQISHRDAAASNIRYLFGYNPSGTSYVTGITSGSGNSLKKVPHLLGQANNTTVPGLMIAGANPFALDSKTPRNKGSQSFIDDWAATDVNHASTVFTGQLVAALGGLNLAFNPAR